MIETHRLFFEKTDNKGYKNVFENDIEQQKRQMEEIGYKVTRIEKIEW